MSFRAPHPDGLVLSRRTGFRRAYGQNPCVGYDHVGAATVYSRILGGKTLTFVWQAGRIHDEQTGSTWDLLGKATDGPLTGSTLTPIVHTDTFWFAYAAFRPETVIRRASR